MSSSEATSKGTAQDKLRFLYLVYVSLGSPSVNSSYPPHPSLFVSLTRPQPDWDFVCQHLGSISKGAASMRLTRLKNEMHAEGLPKSKDDVATSAAGPAMPTKPKTPKTPKKTPKKTNSKRVAVDDGEDPETAAEKKVKVEQKEEDGEEDYGAWAT